MKPLHASLTRLNRCPCCQSKYSKKNNRRGNDGKSSARGKAKLAIRRELNS